MEGSGSTGGRASLKLGIGAELFIIGLSLAGFVLSLLFPLPDAGYSVIGCLWMLAIGAHIVGLGFGVEGFRIDRSKRLALAGILFNLLAIVVWTVLLPVFFSEGG